MDKNNKMVSVIIATRNRPSFLPRALDSVMAQTYQNIETIVVDDASEDSTSLVIDEYRDRIKNFKYIRNDRPYGAAKARNIGISKAAGRYIAFLDDDDEWLPRKIECQANFLDSNPEIAAVSCWFVKDIDGRKIRVIKKERISFENMLWDNFFGSFSFIMVRPEVFNKIGLIDEALSGVDDWELWIRISRIYRIGVVKDFLAIYRWHSGNISRWTQQMLDKYTTVYEKNKSFMSEECRKYHKRKLIINSSKIISEKGKRIEKFFKLLKEYKMNSKKEFRFILGGLFMLYLENSFLKRKISGIFQKPYYTELKTVYENMDRIRERDA